MLSDGDTLKMNDPSVIKDFEGYGQKSFYGRKLKTINPFCSLTF